MNKISFQKKNSGEKILVFLLMLSLIFYFNCSGNRIERISGTSEIIHQYKPSDNLHYMKLHTKEGDVYVLENWIYEKDKNVIKGTGYKLDFNRQPVENGEFNISIDKVVIAETNQISGSSGSSALTLVSIITGIFTIVCLANPKACFGSCPTFYAYDGNDYTIQAEGFSSSISPALEETDIDALFHINPPGRNLELKLKNEAYETHVIRKADILALPRKVCNRVFSGADNNFYEVNNITEPIQAIGDEGDISEKICLFDGTERFSPADSNNLAEKEIIDFTFNYNSPGEKGLVIASRQTLLTTFLFYQSLAYMGTSAGSFLANLERNPEVTKSLIDNPRKLLGSIEVIIEKEDGTFEKVGEVGEHGPISTDIKIVPLGNIPENKEIKIKLRMTKGLWRIDYAAIADILNEVKPIVISPQTSFPLHTKSGSKVTDLLTYHDSVLVTFPGDAFYLNYELPEDFQNYELFLESGGYYLEWMRDEWLVEENPGKVYQMFLNPKQYFKDLAPQFKQIEAEMEETFWSSKYVNP